MNRGAWTEDSRAGDKTTHTGEAQRATNNPEPSDWDSIWPSCWENRISIVYIPRGFLVKKKLFLIIEVIDANCRKPHKICKNIKMFIILQSDISNILLPLYVIDTMLYVKLFFILSQITLCCEHFSMVIIWGYMIFCYVFNQFPINLCCYKCSKTTFTNLSRSFSKWLMSVNSFHLHKSPMKRHRHYSHFRDEGTGSER